MSSLIPSTINPCFPKTSQLQLASSHKNRPMKTQISCKTAENNETQDNNHPNSNSNSNSSRVVDRNAGELIGDRNLELPYWAWDNRAGMTVPDIYEDRCFPLYHSTRSSRVKNKSVVDLSYIPGRTRDPTLNDEDLKIDNLKLMYSKAGDVVAKKDQPDKPQEAGYIENGAHNSRHGWVGENMGKYATAGRDPLFYGLHANVDCIWDVWRNKWGMNDDYTNKDDYKNASFVFYDKDGEPLRVCGKDCFDNDMLGYAYQDVPLEWENYPPSNPKECDKRNNVTRGDGGQKRGPQTGGGRGRGGRGPHRGGGRRRGGGGRRRGGPHRSGGRGRGRRRCGPRRHPWFLSYWIRWYKQRCKGHVSQGARRRRRQKRR